MKSGQAHVVVHHRPVDFDHLPTLEKAAPDHREVVPGSPKYVRRSR
ncbi:MAG: hypothetical protein LBL79_02705 [Prevotella sp.]|nr:hypothetical protein [Prevotella sp.]